MAQVIVEKNQRVLTVTLNRPEVHNALSLEMMREITKAFLSIKKDLTVRAVLITARGPSFCAGGDLNWMRQSIKFTLAQNIKDADTLSKMYESIFHCPVPVLAEVQGNVFGGGLGMVSTCDIAAADENAKFCFSELKIGVVPSVIAPYVLRKIPEKDARHLFLTAETFGAKKAQDCGLIHFTGTAIESRKFIQDRLDMIVHNAPEATRVTKDLLHQIKNAKSPELARRATIKTIAKRRVSKEGQEGLTAFFEKRTPSWK